jgi:cysteine synthase B
VAVEPDDAWHGLEGLKHMASSIVPGIYHPDRLDRKVSVSTDDAYDMVYRIAETEGLLVGQSSGAALLGALEVARELEEGTVVLIFCDWGERYLSTKLWTGWDRREGRRG